MATVEETIITGRKYRVWDAVNSIWKRLSYWTKASDVEFNDGLNLEDKIIEVNGNIDENTEDINSLNDYITAEDDLKFQFSKSGTEYGYKDSQGNFLPIKSNTINYNNNEVQILSLSLSGTTLSINTTLKS